MFQVHKEYLKLFNQVEFDLNINRIYQKDQVTGTNVNLCKRPVHYKYVPNRNNNISVLKETPKFVAKQIEIPAPAPGPS